MLTTPPSAHLIGTKLGNYRLERLLGRGRMGMVYLARDEALLRPIAIKLLAWNIPDAQHHDPEAWLLAEARNIARVNHPAVIQVHGVARHGPHAYIAMEYVDGVSADRIVQERGPFTPAVATQILLQIAGALQAAHEGGVIHRDVKPANILIRADSSAKLGDFGMSIYRQSPAHATGEHQVGTPLYTAPELWSGAPATPSSDLYALGATYHFLLSGHAPFEPADLTTLIEAHRQQAPPLLDELALRLPPGCVEIVRRCLAKSPTERVSSAKELSWLARGALREIETWRREHSRNSLARSAPALERRDSLHKRLGLSRAPFSDSDGAPGLATFEPFRRAAAELASALEEPGNVVCLCGATGNGASRLLREIARPPLVRGQVAWLGADGALANDSLAQRACRAFGALPSTRVATDSALEGLLEQLADAVSDGAGPALLVVESSYTLKSLAREIEPLVLAAHATKYFNMVVLGGGEGDNALPGTRLVQLPPLSRQELLEYLSSCLRTAHEPTTLPLLITPDAALLLYHRSAGNLAQVNRLATRMLELAAAHHTHVINSWVAWLALQGPDTPAPSLSAWPTAEVLAILNAERALAALPPREASRRSSAS